MDRKQSQIVVVIRMYQVDERSLAAASGELFFLRRHLSPQNLKVC
jgi:hypothetical protein